MPGGRGYIALGAMVAVLLVGLAATSGVASAGHDPEAANYTVTPLEDRSPGAEDVRYGQTVVGTAGVDLETLTRTLAIYEEGSWSDCGPTSASVFGIDRGDTHDGYEIDEELTNNVKRFSAGEDRLETEYNGENDIGASTYLNDGDEFVSVADCIDNPDQPGWYQIAGRTTGVTADDEEVTFGGRSHYFWICDCADEAAAREQLGSPPSEPDATPTPVSTEAATRTDTDGTAAPADDEAGERTFASTETERTATPTATPGNVADQVTTDTAGSPRRTRTGTATDSWAAIVYRTPTRKEGTGFGPIVALAALVIGALLVDHRR